MIDHRDLKSKILADSALASAVARRDLNAIAEHLNIAHVGAVTRELVDRNTLIGDMGALISRLCQAQIGGTDAQKTGATFWLGLYDRLLAPKDTINMQNAVLEDFFAQLAQQGWLSETERASFFVQDGSLAETWYGVGTVIDPVADVAFALALEG